MTCVVGLIEKGVIYMGADSLASDVIGTHVVNRADEKVFINGRCIIGFCGSYRVGQLLRHAFTVPEQPQRHDDMAFMVVEFVDALRALQKEKGSMKKEDEVETHPADILVGYRGNLYVVEDDFNVGRPLNNFYAVGAGGQIAFGSLYATQGLVKDPRKRVLMALEAATTYNAACRGPYTVLELKHDA
jgi:ATP-dependent protease HslVU (ClpYQ) peptidase subunit